MMPKVLSPLRRNLRPEPAPNRKRWTRRDCEFLVQNELLTGRYELIDGQIISKMGQRPPHAFVIMRLTAWMVAAFGGDYIRIQLPIDVADIDSEINEPEPDAVVLTQPDVMFLDHTPGPEAVMLVIEVSDSTLRFDRRTKALLYARDGIGEYWVVDVVGRRLYAHREPAATGYRQILEYSADETICPLQRPDAEIALATLLPPEE